MVVTIVTEEAANLGCSCSVTGAVLRHQLPGPPSSLPRGELLPVEEEPRAEAT